MKVRAAFFLLIAIALGPLAVVFHGQGQTDVKIRLMAEALTARDAGDFVGAKQKLESLLQIVPGDAGVKRLITEMDNRQAEKEYALAHPPPPPVVAPASPVVVAPVYSAAEPAPATSTSPVSPVGSRSAAVGTAAASGASVSPSATTSLTTPVHTESVEQVSGISVITEGRPTPPPGPTDRYAEALAIVEKEGVAYARAGDDRWEKLMTYVQAQRALARVYAKDGNYAAATSTLEEALSSLESSVDDLKSERRDYVRKEVEAREAKKGVHLRRRR